MKNKWENIKSVLAVAMTICVTAGTVAFAPVNVTAEESKAFTAGTDEACQTVFFSMDSYWSIALDRIWVIKNDNTLWVWDTSDVFIKILDDVKSVSDFKALKNDGSLWILSNNSESDDALEPIKIMDDVKYLCSGAYVIKTDDSLWTWNIINGGNEFWNQERNIDKIEPVKIMGDVKNVSISENYYGWRHFMAIKTDNSLWALGNNEYGQLGDGTTKDKIEPVKIMDDVASVSTSNVHTLAVKTNGSLWAWGNNEYGQLGDGTITIRDDNWNILRNNNKSTPVKIMDDVTSALALGGEGSAYSMVIKTDGSLWSWGDNSSQQLGGGTIKKDPAVSYYGYSGYRTKPIKILDDVKSVCHGAAIKNDGSLWVWGCYYSSLISYEHDLAIASCIEVPTKIIDGNVTGVYHSGTFILIIKDDESLWEWGDSYRSGMVEIIDYLGFKWKDPAKIIDSVQLPNKIRGVTVMLNGEKLDLTLPVINENGEMMYPLRECLEAMGARVVWYDISEVAMGVLYGKTVEFIIGSDVYRVNGKRMQMDEGVVPFIKDGSTYIPIRYAAEALGFTVEWDEKTQTININTNSNLRYR